MARIPDDEIHRLKQDVAVARLAAARAELGSGLALT